MKGEMIEFFGIFSRFFGIFLEFFGMFWEFFGDLLLICPPLAPSKKHVPPEPAWVNPAAPGPALGALGGVR